LLFLLKSLSKSFFNKTLPIKNVFCAILLFIKFEKWFVEVTEDAEEEGT